MTQRLTGSESEPSVQEEIFKSLLRTPHRFVDEALQIHHAQLLKDPFLYGCLAVYGVIEGQCAIRDVQNVFVATLFVSDFPEHREAAWVMLQGLPPHRVEKVVRYLTGFSEVVKHTSQDKKPMPDQGMFGVSYERAKTRAGVEIPRVVTKVSKALRRHVGQVSELTVDTWRVRHDYFNRSLSRTAKNAVTTYLRFRENNRLLMEGAILRMRNPLKYLYAKIHLLPEGNEDGWVNQALFHGVEPEGSRLEAMKELIAETDPVKQSKIIVAAKLPYPLVRSLIKKTPSTTVASIMVMTPQEVLANQETLRRDGAFNNPEIKELLHSKLKEIKTAKKSRVDAFKGEIAAKAVAGLDADTKALLSDITDHQLKQHGSIGVSTMVLVDKSYSLQEAIEQGKRIAASLAQACGDKFAGCMVFDSNARMLRWTAKDGDITTYSAWQKKFKMVTANGGTNPADCLRAMIRSGTSVDQLVIVTDEDENVTGSFAEALGPYKEKFGHMPDIVITRLGHYACDKMSRTAKAVGAEVTVMDCTKTDNIALPNLIQLCSKKSVFDLVQEILELPLPTKTDWFSKQPVKRKTKKKKSDHPAMVL